MCASGLSKTDAEKMAVLDMSNIQLIFFQKQLFSQTMQRN
ncbi:hypothetical protein I33_0903 [Bacillus subtilis subsp. subtilis str. RO-NN-1]|nr:hypothetical protein I33_0903 [Bacillus subtilis subsp. subtilis str. RO-NN-1]